MTKNVSGGATLYQAVQALIRVRTGRPYEFGYSFSTYTALTRTVNARLGLVTVRRSTSSGVKPFASS
jgi:hypothetical protein